MVHAYDLRAGKSKGCGCTRYANAGRAAAAVTTTHGKTHTREYRIWTDMRRRCLQPQRPDFERYGGRGITVCDRWRNDFAAFYADMGACPDKHTLERLDNDGPYSPENCEWRTKKAQLNNTRVNRKIVVGGERMTMTQASEKFEINLGTLHGRLQRGWNHEQAATKPRRRYRHAKARLPHL